MFEGLKKSFFEIVCIVSVFGMLLFVGVSEEQSLQNNSDRVDKANLINTDINEWVKKASREERTENYIATINAKNLDFDNIDLKYLGIISYNNGTVFSNPIMSDSFCKKLQSDDGNSFVLYTKDDLTKPLFVYYKDSEGKLRVKVSGADKDNSIIGVLFIVLFGSGILYFSFIR